MPPRKISPIVRRRGLERERVMGSELSSSWTSVGPVYHCARGSVEWRVMLSPWRPEQGMKVIFFWRKPAVVRKEEIWVEMSVKRPWSQLTVSSLLTAIIMRWTPMLLTRSACSLVWPLSPDSKEPPLASITSTAKSA